METRATNDRWAEREVTRDPMALGDELTIRHWRIWGSRGFNFKFEFEFKFEFQCAG